MSEPVSTASIIVVAGPEQPPRISLEGLSLKTRLIFGRHKSCDHVLKHQTISRSHFAIERTAGKLFVVDQDSQNGTFVNDERVSWVEVNSGDRIKAGPFIMILEMPDEGRLEAGSGADATTVPDIAHKEVSAAQPEKYLPREYTEGIAHFNSGRYYDAHEIWEEIWLRSRGTEKLFYQMLIQSAVGLHHYERGNMIGARGMHSRVTDKLTGLPDVFLSLDLTEFSLQFRTFFRDLIESGIEGAPSASKPRPHIRLLKGDRES
jgi:uncharacterized protein